jgi:hypothetical protein
MGLSAEILRLRSLLPLVILLDNARRSTLPFGASASSSGDLRPLDDPDAPVDARDGHVLAHGRALDPALFARVHRSYIVRLDRVREIRRANGAELAVSDGSVLPVSRRRRPALEALLKPLAT